MESAMKFVIPEMYMKNKNLIVVHLDRTYEWVIIIHPSNP